MARGSDYYWVKKLGPGKYIVDSEDGDFGGPIYKTRREAEREIRRLEQEHEESSFNWNPTRRGAATLRKARAASAMLKAMNPASKVRAVRVTKLKGGGVSVIPVKVKVLRRGRR